MIESELSELILQNISQSQSLQGKYSSMGETVHLTPAILTKENAFQGYLEPKEMEEWNELKIV